jgi:large subunit ribosomal protein L21
MNYAIIRTGGKQYRVRKDEIIDVELLEQQEPGAILEFKDILFIQNGSDALIGGPFLTDFIVRGEVLGISKGSKVTSVKYIPGNHTKKFGHRQKYLKVRITEIGGSNGS